MRVLSGVPVMAQDADLPAYFGESWATVAQTPFRSTFGPVDSTGTIASAPRPTVSAAVPLPPRRPAEAPAPPAARVAKRAVQPQTLF
jgi:hypothetical protein